MIISFGIYVIAIFFSFIFYYFAFSKAEGTNVFTLSNKGKAFTSAFLGLSAFSFMFLGYRNLFSSVIIGILYGFILFNSLSDMYSRNVYTGLTFLFFILGSIYQCFILKTDIRLFIIFFATSIFLHLFLLRGLYGSGDAKIFLILTLFYKEPNLHFLALHLLFAFLFFTIVNIGEKKQKRYKLENPKAFVPYIAATSLLFI